MDEEQSEEHSSGVCGCGLSHDMMEGLTAEQKKKLAAMHIDIKILFFETLIWQYPLIDIENQPYF